MKTEFETASDVPVEVRRLVSGLPVNEWVSCPVNFHVKTIKAAMNRGLIEHRNTLPWAGPLRPPRLKWGKVRRTVATNGDLSDREN